MWIVVGFGLDSAGSYVEVYCIDRRRKDHAEMLEVWWRYLRIAWAHEPIGQHYLRRMLVSFKFELNMFVAVMVCTVGFGLLGFSGAVRWPIVVAVEVVLGSAALLLANAARGSSEVLADVRANLVKGVGEPPFDQSDNPRTTNAG